VIKGVLFDMDGVLVDSEAFILEAAMTMFKELGLETHPEDFEAFVGTGENRYLGGVAEKYGLDLQIDSAKARTYEIFASIIRGRLEPLPGARDFIDRCRRKGLRLALATSADRVKMEANLREIGMPPETFDALVNGLDVEHRKPDPEIYQTAAARLGVDCSECLVVEDALSGLAAARAAGARCLMLETSFPRERFSGADWIALDLSQAPEEAISW
jgi:HAD superfamily hydrolase (TIGR01509 family)